MQIQTAADTDDALRAEAYRLKKQPGPVVSDMLRALLRHGGSVARDVETVQNVLDSILTLSMDHQAEVVMEGDARAALEAFERLRFHPTTTEEKS